MLNLGAIYKTKTPIGLWENSIKETQIGTLQKGEIFIVVSDDEERTSYCVMLTSQGIFRSSRVVHLFNASTFFERIS